MLHAKRPPSHLDLYIKLGQMQKSFFKENKPVSAMHWYSAFLIVNKPTIVICIYLGVLL